MRLVLVMSIMFASLVPHFAFAKAPFEIKGIRLGISEAELRAHVQGIDCGDNTGIELGERGCFTFSPNGEFKTIGGNTVKAYTFDFIDDKLGHVYILFASEVYPEMISVTKEKFGTPTSTRRTNMQNGMGATFTNEVVVWKRVGAILEIEKYTSTIDNMSLTLVSEKFMADASRLIKKRSRERARDL